MAIERNIGRHKSTLGCQLSTKKHHGASLRSWKEDKPVHHCARRHHRPAGGGPGSPHRPHCPRLPPVLLRGRAAGIAALPPPPPGGSPRRPLPPLDPRLRRLRHADGGRALRQGEAPDCHSLSHQGRLVEALLIIIPSSLLTALVSLYLSRRAGGRRGGNTIQRINSAGDWDRKF